MPQKMICRLCINSCTDYKTLYSANDDANKLYELIHEYFHPKIVDLNEAKDFRVICRECFTRIYDFHSFQATVTVAQLKLIGNHKETTTNTQEKDNPTVVKCEMDTSRSTALVNGNDAVSITETHLPLEDFQESPFVVKIKNDLVARSEGTDALDSDSINRAQEDEVDMALSANNLMTLRMAKAKESNLRAAPEFNRTTRQTTKNTKRSKCNLSARKDGLENLLNGKRYESPKTRSTTRKSNPKVQTHHSDAGSANIFQTDSIPSSPSPLSTSFSNVYFDYDAIQETFNCKLCGKRYVSAESTKAHIKKFHRREAGKVSTSSGIEFGPTPKLFQCKMCVKAYASPYSLKMHRQRYHPQESDNFLHLKSDYYDEKTKRYKCPLCTNSFPYKSNVFKHINLRHSKQGHNVEATAKNASGDDIGGTKRRFDCKVCSITYGSIGGWYSHMRTQHPARLRRIRLKKSQTMKSIALKDFMIEARTNSNKKKYKFNH